MRKFGTYKFDTRNKRRFFLMYVLHVNGWEPAIYINYMNQNFRLFLVSNLSVLNYRIFLPMYPRFIDTIARPEERSSAERRRIFQPTRTGPGPVSDGGRESVTARPHDQMKTNVWNGRMHSISQTNGSFASFNSCKLLRLYCLHKWLVTLIEFIRSKRRFYSHAVGLSGATETRPIRCALSALRVFRNGLSVTVWR